MVARPLETIPAGKVCEACGAGVGAMEKDDLPSQMVSGGRVKESPSNRNPLDLIERDLIRSAVVELGGAR